MSTKVLSCPRCRRPLQKLVQHGVVAFRCGGCGSAFYPPAELKRALGAPPNLGSMASLSLEGEAGLECPSCAGTLQERRASGDARLLVDLCARCGGVLLDKGELSRLAALTRQLHSQRRRAVERARDADTSAMWAQAVTSMATARATRDADDLADSPGVLRSLLMVLGLPVDSAHSASRPAWLIWGLLLVHFVIFGVQVDDPGHLRHWRMIPSEVLAGRDLWTIFTSNLIHSGFGHLFGNMYMLWMAGDNLEARLGSLPTLALYLVAGLGSTAAVLITDSHGTIGYLGASGCISGLLGAYTMLFPRSRVHLLPRWGLYLFRPVALPAIVFFAFWFVSQILGILSGGEGIAFWAHIGGFIAGAVWGFLARPISEV